LEQDIGEKERYDMKKNIEYSKSPEELSETLEYGKRVLDFLPPPSELARKAPKVKVTITLNQRSIEFFKRQAISNHTKYQTMINDVLDQYAQRYTEQSDSIKTL
jgi:uncharacterized protein (DUF4415 family)